jgi:uncharacterized membrane protein
MTGRHHESVAQGSGQIARVFGWACVAAGAMLATRRAGLAVPQGLATAAVALAGLAAFDLAGRRRPMRRRASRQSESDGSLRLVQSIAISRPAQACYEWVRQLEQLPLVLPEVERLEPAGDAKQTRWRTRRAGEWRAEITQDDAPSLIAWRARAADLVVDGSVRFTPIAGRDGTVVRVVLRALPGSDIGDRLGRMVGVGPEADLKQGLRRLKQVLETGEVLAVEGQPRGRGRLTITRLLSAA